MRRDTDHVILACVTDAHPIPGEGPDRAHRNNVISTMANVIAHSMFLLFPEVHLIISCGKSLKKM